MAPSSESKSALQMEREKLDLELLQLDLEEKRENAETRRAMRDQRLRNRNATEASLTDARQMQELAQANCPHRKGGKDIEGLFQGNSPNYAVIKHTLPQGGTMVVCQRCQKTWMPPVRAEYKITGEYADALRLYRAALDLPTDNTPSGTQIFDVRTIAA